MTSGPITPPSMPGAGAQPPSSGQVVKIVTLPESLQTVSRATRIEGEVTGQNDDGSTRIATPKGNIDIMIRGRQPQPGARIEIDIPPGTPPRNVTMRPAPPPPAGQPPTPQPQSPPPATPPAAPQPAPPPSQTRPPAPAAPSLPSPGQANAPAAPPTTTTASPGQATSGGAPTSSSTLPPLDGTGQAYRPAPASLPAAYQPAPPHAQPPATDMARPAIPASPMGASPALPAIVRLMPVAAEPAPAAMPGHGGPSPAPSPAANMPARGVIGALFGALKSALPNLPTASAPAISPPAHQTQAAPARPLALPPALTGRIVAILPPFDATGGLARGPAPQPGSASAPATAPSLLATSAGAEPASAKPPGSIMPAPSLPGVAAPAASVPTAATPTTATAASPATITLTVTFFTSDNRPVVMIPLAGGQLQPFIIQTSAIAAPPGAQIILEPMLGEPARTPVMATGPSPTLAPTSSSPALSSAAALPPAWRALLPAMQAASIWSAMDDLFQSFYQATPQAAQILARVLPSPAGGASLGPAMMLFAAAIKAGDIQGWLGERKLQMIERLGKAEIVSRLSAETAPLAADAPLSPTDWKTFPMPMLWQSEISKVMFHVRAERDERSETGETGTRFIMDLSLTRMGEVQLDGLVRGGRLDLIVRTERPVSEMMQDAMRNAYANALDGSGIYGEIGFQGDMSGQVRIVARDPGTLEQAV